MTNLKVEKFNLFNTDKIAMIYENFRSTAIKDYKYDAPPLLFKNMQKTIKKDLVKGYVLFEDNKADGFLLFSDGYEGVIEINLLYIKSEKNLEEKQELLLKEFLKNLEDNKKWQVMSYPLMGKQALLDNVLKKHDFGFVGQAIYKINILEENVFEKLNAVKIKQVKFDYSIAAWNHEYFEGVSNVLNNAFKTANDTKFDPRFKTIEGSKDIVYNIISGKYGYFDPELTSIASNGQEILGACFVNFTTPEKANISIVAVDPKYSGNNIGTALLKHSIDKLMTQNLNGKYNPHCISATLDIDSPSALKMYKKIGFKEDYVYKHAYLLTP